METIREKLSHDNVLKVLLASVLIILAVLLRLVDHPANFAPIAAVALFAGALFPKKWALTLPLIAMILSDAVIGFHGLIFLTWGSFMLIALFSGAYIKKISPKYVVTASLFASVIFFVITNFGVWAQGRLYSLNFEGLMMCYFNALPFFRNTLMGDLIYSTVLFGGYALIYRYVFNKSGQLLIKKSAEPLNGIKSSS